MTGITYITQPGGAGEYTRYLLADADGSNDPNSIISGSPSDDGTWATVTIDKDQGAAYQAPDAAAIWYWDTGLTAADAFMIPYRLKFKTFATVDESDIVVYAGVTSNTSDLANYSYAAGMDFSLASPRAIRWRNTTAANSGQLATARGFEGVIVRGPDDVAWNAAGHLIDANDDSTATALTATPSRLTANSSSDSIYFCLWIGFSLQAAATVDVEFALEVSPVIQNSL